MKKVLVVTAMVVAGAMSASVSARETASAGASADQLVGLIKPDERDAQAIRFMISVAPMEMPAGLADCTVREAVPGMRAYYASQLSENLSPAQLQQAIKFFQSAAGQEAVARRLAHEQNLLSAVARGERIADEQLHYPASVQKELDAFGATPAGKFFVTDDIFARAAIRSHVSDLRSAAMVKCLTAAK